MPEGSRARPSTTTELGPSLRQDGPTEILADALASRGGTIGGAVAAATLVVGVAVTGQHLTAEPPATPAPTPAPYAKHGPTTFQFSVNRSDARAFGGIDEGRQFSIAVDAPDGGLLPSDIAEARVLGVDTDGTWHYLGGAKARDFTNPDGRPGQAIRIDGVEGQDLTFFGRLVVETSDADGNWTTLGQAPVALGNPFPPEQYPLGKPVTGADIVAQAGLDI